MRTSTLVQASADVITVVSLAPGDVYKRLQKNTYGEQYELQFGVVQDVMHNGEDAVITALEFAVSYNGVEPKLKTFGTDTDLKLFTAQPEEVVAHFAELREATRLSVQKAEAEAVKQRELAARVESLVESVNARPLTAASTTVAELAR